MQVIYFVWCTAVGLSLLVAGFVIAMATMVLVDKYLSGYKISKIIWNIARTIFFILGGILIVMACYRCGDVITSYLF